MINGIDLRQGKERSRIGILTSIIVLVNGLQPANIIVRMCHKMYINQVVIGLCTTLRFECNRRGGRENGKRNGKNIDIDSARDDLLLSDEHNMKAITF